MGGGQTRAKVNEQPGELRIKHKRIVSTGLIQVMREKDPNLSESSRPSGEAGRRLVQFFWSR